MLLERGPPGDQAEAGRRRHGEPAAQLSRTDQLAAEFVASNGGPAIPGPTCGSQCATGALDVPEASSRYTKSLGARTHVPSPRSAA